MMFHEVVRILFHFVTIFYYVTGETLTKRNGKRISVRNNYPMCLDSFDIHRDKIIRTYESRDRGAKYLNETEVDSKEECLKFCCDTVDCDVFIFEEKKPGSCYLFQCGPLHDFKCKFTSHANYSSAVRTKYNTETNAQLQEEIRISQQEHELKSLRNLAEPAPMEYSYTEPSMKLIATLAPKLSVTTQLTKQACSRINQYECRTSGDCIAVYNVCDGIPQCADGSDEAADLCPTEKPTIPPPLMQRPQPPQSLLPIDVIKYQPAVDSHKSLAPLYARVPEVNPKPWELSNIAHPMVPQQQPLLYPAQQLEGSLHKIYGAPGYQWDYQPLYEQNKDMYNPVNSFHEPNNINSYEQNQPHIFNHKGSGVIGEKEADNGALLDVRHPYTSHFVSPNRDRDSWQNTQVFPSPSPLPNVQQKQIHEAEGNIIITTTPPCEISHEQTDLPLKTKETKKVDQQGEKHFAYQKEVDQNNNKENILKKETPKHNHVQAAEPKENKNLIVIKDHMKEHGKDIVMVEPLKQVNEIEILRPRGAVISLALGLTITAITATLIVCRLRVVRRRGKRHGPYAHDADYLVNGMYL